MREFTIIASAVFVILFACLVTSAAVHLWKSGPRDPTEPVRDARDKKKRPGAKKGRPSTRPGWSDARKTRPAPEQKGRPVTTRPKRGRRLLRRDSREALLPRDATITFAAERKDADIDEVFTA